MIQEELAAAVEGITEALRNDWEARWRGLEERNVLSDILSDIHLPGPRSHHLDMLLFSARAFWTELSIRHPSDIYLTLKERIASEEEAKNYVEELKSTAVSNTVQVCTYDTYRGVIKHLFLSIKAKA